MVPDRLGTAAAVDGGGVDVHVAAIHPQRLPFGGHGVALEDHIAEIDRGVARPHDVEALVALEHHVMELGHGVGDFHAGAIGIVEAAGHGEAGEAGPAGLVALDVHHRAALIAINDGVGAAIDAVEVDLLAAEVDALVVGALLHTDARGGDRGIDRVLDELVVAAAFTIDHEVGNGLLHVGVGLGVRVGIGIGVGVGVGVRVGVGIAITARVVDPAHLDAARGVAGQQEHDPGVLQHGYHPPSSE